jgi:hypothetical protein
MDAPLEPVPRPVAVADRLPYDDELEPKLRYCWWWHWDDEAWYYCDARHCDPGRFTHHLHWQTFPHPGREETKTSKAVERLQHFVAEYKQMRGLDPEYVYGVHAGDATREASVRISDLESVLARYGSAPRPVPVAGDVSKEDGDG